MHACCLTLVKALSSSPVRPARPLSSTASRSTRSNAKIVKNLERSHTISKGTFSLFCLAIS